MLKMYNPKSLITKISSNVRDTLCNVRTMTIPLAIVITGLDFTVMMTSFARFYPPPPSVSPRHNVYSVH